MRCPVSVRALTALARSPAQLLHGPAPSQPHYQSQLCSQQLFSVSEGFAKRFYSAPPDSDEDVRVPGNPKVDRIVEEILSLNLIEVADLSQILSQRLNIQPGAFAPGMMAQGASQQAASTAEATPAKEPEPEKTEFDVKLQSFDAAAKIKVIKEVRAITSLGLKEAKELVEKAPTVVKAGVAKAEAEEILKKIEAAGGKVALE